MRRRGLTWWLSPTLTTRQVRRAVAAAALWDDHQRYSPTLAELTGATIRQALLVEPDDEGALEGLGAEALLRGAVALGPSALDATALAVHGEVEAKTSPEGLRLLLSAGLDRAGVVRLVHLAWLHGYLGDEEAAVRVVLESGREEAVVSMRVCQARPFIRGSQAQLVTEAFLELDDDALEVALVLYADLEEPVHHAEDDEHLAQVRRAGALAEVCTRTR